jgi:endogenous inhibitor of DNA gyrase (YacG/DUF329 family)
MMAGEPDHVYGVVPARGYCPLTSDLRTLLMRCPICHCEFESDQSPALPFCSERCRTIDLGRWLGEGYLMPIPTDPDAESPAAEAPPADDQSLPESS